VAAHHKEEWRNLTTPSPDISGRGVREGVKRGKAQEKKIRSLGGFPKKLYQNDYHSEYRGA